MLRFCCKSCANKITTTERHKTETIFNKNKNLTAELIWKYDKLKDKLAKNKGITLLHIKEYDWLNDKFKEKEKIKKYIDKC